MGELGIKIYSNSLCRTN